MIMFYICWTTRSAYASNIWCKVHDKNSEHIWTSYTPEMIGRCACIFFIFSFYGHAGVLDDSILCGFRCAFSCMFQYSLCHGMDIGTCDIVHWSAAPHNHIANRTGLSVYVVLVLNVIRYSCHYFLDRIIFHRDFHHDSCDFHWDFYGH